MVGMQLLTVTKGRKNVPWFGTWNHRLFFLHAKTLHCTTPLI